MIKISTRTVTIAAYKADIEPTLPPANEDADIVRVHVTQGRRAPVNYEFAKNPPGWGMALKDYKWVPYRRSHGPLGWLTEND